MARRAPSNNLFLCTATNGVLPFFFRGILNPRSEDVDLYICEHCGQLLVAVGECAVRIAGYGLLKLLRSRCFATIELSPYFAKQPNVSRNATSVRPPSPVAVRAATLISARDLFRH